jgi:periplasmic copper chaperone A
VKIAAPKETSMMFKTLFSLATAGVLAGAAALSHAHGYDAGPIRIGHPWARPTVAGQSVGGGYLSLHNQGPAADRLVSARVDVAGSVELHTMSMDGNVMRMREVGAIDIPAGQKVELQPGGLHLMFMGLKAPLKVGDRFPMTLRFEKAGEVKVEVVVQLPKAADGAKPADQHHQHKP